MSSGKKEYKNIKYGTNCMTCHDDSPEKPCFDKAVLGGARLDKDLVRLS